MTEAPRIVKYVYADATTGRVTNVWRGHSYSATMPPIPLGHVRREVPLDDGIDYSQWVWDGADGFVPISPDATGRPLLTAQQFRQQFSPEEWLTLCDLIHRTGSA